MILEMTPGALLASGETLRRRAAVLAFLRRRLAQEQKAATA